MDGDQGNLYINPEKETLALFKARVATEQELGSTIMELQTFTRDRVRVKLLANINLLGEIALSRRLKCRRDRPVPYRIPIFNQELLSVRG